jgi:hypothetical protein
VPRHRFDPVALVFGTVFVAAGAIVLAGGELIEEGSALVPVGLVALGVALLVHVSRRARPSAPAAAAPTSPVAGDSDLDSLFAPVDEALADWDRTHASSGPSPAADATQTDPTQPDPTQPGATQPGATEADATEVIDPTERYPRSGPE